MTLMPGDAVCSTCNGAVCSRDLITQTGLPADYSGPEFLVYNTSKRGFRSSLTDDSNQQICLDHDFNRQPLVRRFDPDLCSGRSSASNLCDGRIIDSTTFPLG